MKKSTIISILLLAFCSQTWACGGEDFTYNCDMFSVYDDSEEEKSLFTEQFDKFWKTYTNGKVTEYLYNNEEIMEIAKKKNDTEMVNYLTQLNRYLDISDELRDTWNYPTKEELAQRKTDLNAMITKANSYKGTRLKAQWELLHMRANMVLGNHAANISHWEQQVSKLPSSPYRDMMRNIYAGALLHEGRRGEACDIYAEQEDLLSIKWAMRKHRNLAGIKAIFNERPESPTMNYLVQDFVNNIQGRLDFYDEWQWEMTEDILETTSTLKKDANSFISFAQKVVNEKKTKSPAMWMAAIGELQYMTGQYNEAMKTLNKAVETDGTQRMKDNARAIRLIASVKTGKFDQAYTRWLTDEFNWLIQKAKEEGHYYAMIERLVYKNLVPHYTKAGQPNMAAALLLMVNGSKFQNLVSKNTWEYYLDYSSEHFNYIDKMTPDALVSYKDFLQSKAQNSFEALVKKHIDVDVDYYNDLIGTAYLACDDLKKATQYLSLVPLSFIKKQNISPYTVRDFTKARWFGKQKINDYSSPSITSNPKLKYCNDLTTLKSNYAKSKGEARKQLAYDIAVRYFQASHKGDCWYLTQYGQSCYDTIRVDRANLMGKALELLEESATSSNETLKLNSLYALAYIPIDEWCDISFNWSTNKFEIGEIYKDSKQYANLFNLHQYTKNKNRLPSYVTKCDILKKFRANL
ncbi:MAG: hypothetical protein IKH88_17470 [Prevotella sp.]|nr:hypothetical protein [Prevotella sp.]